MTKIIIHLGDQTGGSRKSNKFAAFSSIAYANNLDEKKKLLKKYNKIGFIIDEGLTNDDFTVFHKSKTGETVVASRGTDFSTKTRGVRDMLENTGIAFGITQFSSRRKSGTKLTEKAIEKYGKDNLTLTGHSLGGNVSGAISRKLDIPAELFAVGSSPFSRNPLSMMLDKSNGKIKSYDANNIKKGDIDLLSVSNAVFGNDKRTYIPKKEGEKSAHSLKNFEGTEEEYKQEGEGRTQKGRTQKGRTQKGKTQKGQGESKNKWIRHLKSYRANHLDLTYKQCMMKAKDTY
jgi:predicted esterase YcpF (UPF0227 family)